MWCYKIIFGLVDIDANHFLHSVLFPILEDIDIKFLNHIVLEYVALSSVKELSTPGTTYLLMLILV